MNSVGKHEPSNERSLSKVKRTAALGAAALIVAAIVVVYFFPAGRASRDLAITGGAIGLAAATLCGLTWRRAIRIRIGRMGLRFRGVRLAAGVVAAIALLLPLLWVAAGWRYAYSPARFLAETRPPKTLTVAVAKFDGDYDDRIRERFVTKLRAFTAGLPISCELLDAAIPIEPKRDTPDWISREQAAERGRAAQSQIILWGRVESGGNGRRIALFEEGLGYADQFGQGWLPNGYDSPRLDPETVALHATVMILSMLVYSQHHNNSQVVNRLDALTARLRNLSDANFKSGPWTAEDRASVDFTLASAIEMGWNPPTNDLRTRLSNVYVLSAIANWSAKKNPFELAMALRFFAGNLIIISNGMRDRAIDELAARAVSEASALYPVDRDSIDRARTQLGLGQILMGMALVDRSANDDELRRALAADQSALALCDRQRNPNLWAKARWGIANVQLRAGETRGDVAQLRAAIDSFNQALTIFTRADAPQQWARTQTRLGEALLDLGYHDAASGYFGEAVAAEQSALEVLTPAQDPSFWSLAHAYKGMALQAKAAGPDGVAILQNAVAELRAARSDALYKVDPYAWVRVQSALASSLASLGDAELFPDPSMNEYRRARLSHEDFEEAVAAARAGIGEARRLKMKDQLAFLQSALAGALIGIANEETAYNRDAAAANHLREAAAAAKAALAIQTPDKNGESWADTEAMLGEALSRLGRIDRNPNELKAAVAAYQASMSLQTRDRDPQNWNADENGIATALENLGLVGSASESLTYLRQAAAIQRELLTAAPPETNPGNWYISQSNLARIETELGEREPDGADLRLAAADYHELLRHVSPADSPGEWRDLNQQLDTVVAMMRRRGVAG
jgi:tetratricopeptide (TPR) repeat protein